MRFRSLLLPLAIVASLAPVAPAHADSKAFRVKIILENGPVVSTEQLATDGIKVGFYVYVQVFPAGANVRPTVPNPTDPNNPLFGPQDVGTGSVGVPLAGIPVELRIGGLAPLQNFTIDTGPTRTPGSTGPAAYFKIKKSDFDAIGLPFGPVPITAVALSAASPTEANNVEIAGRASSTAFFDTRLPVPGLVESIDSGESHTCALISNGTVRCWGAGTRNQIGNGAGLDVNRATTVQTPDGDLSNVVSLDVGANHACAIVSDPWGPVAEAGAVWCWGHNQFGQLGTLNTAPSVYATEAKAAAGTPLVGAVSVAAGKQHTCAVMVDSTVRCWGLPTSIEKAPWLGRGTSATPVILTSATGDAPLMGAVQVVAGPRHTCAMLYTGSVYCWGDSADGRIGEVPSKPFNPQRIPTVTTAKFIAAGGAHTCAVQDGATTCWGMNVLGQLGRGETVSEDPQPVSLSGTPKAMALGSKHSCFLVDDTVSCTGSNAEGQFGNGGTSDALTPVAISNASRSIGVSAGDNHSCFLGPRGQIAFVQCTGLNDHFQIGNELTLPTLVPKRTSGLTGIAEIATGLSHSCALLAGGEGVRCWGKNNDGQLGDGTTTQRLSSVRPPDANAPPANAYGVQAGRAHTCLLAGTAGDNTGDDLYCWGDNSFGQLGNGTTTDLLVPTKITGINPIAIALGDDHTCAVLPAAAGQRKSVRCWGANATGQVGDDTTVGPKTSPTAVTDLAGTQVLDVLSIDAGGNHTCAVMLDNSMRCWGSNSNYQLGTTSITMAKKPRKPEFVSGAAAVTTGGNFTCYTNALETVRCFGANEYYGQLGTVGPDTALPTSDAGGMTGVAKIVAGEEHMCAVASTGAMKCWGSNVYSQLGADTSPDNFSSDGIGAAPSEVIDPAPGNTHTCVVLFTANAMCWGSNANGQIGDGTTVDAPNPISISIT